LRILWVKQKRPDNHARVWEVEFLPMITPVHAAIRTILGASIDYLRVLWMHGNGPHLGASGQPMAERLPAVVADGFA
jgi:hypothetical protein